jgi:HEAT repeat protein
LSLCGCAVSWDDVTSRDFKVKEFWAKPPEPLYVLRDSKDGDKRAKAYRALKEPKANGGTDQDQDVILNIVATGAKAESSYYARLEAMRKLGEFKDPRAVHELVEAYYQADSLLGKDGRDHTVSKELISTFRCEVLRGLGNNGNPAAAELLVTVLNARAKVKGPEEDARMALDERIAAARALKHYPQYASVEALVAVLKNDKDVALRDCATESLQACTGKNLPADYAAWDDYVHHQTPNGAIAGEKKKGVMDYILTGFAGVKPW